MSWVLRKDRHKRERRKNRQFCEPTYTEMAWVQSTAGSLSPFCSLMPHFSDLAGGESGLQEAKTSFHLN